MQLPRVPNPLCFAADPSYHRLDPRRGSPTKDLRGGLRIKVGSTSMTAWKTTSSSGMDALYRPKSSTLPARACYSDLSIHIGHGRCGVRLSSGMRMNTSSSIKMVSTSVGETRGYCFTCPHPSSVPSSLNFSILNDS